MSLNIPSQVRCPQACGLGIASKLAPTRIAPGQPILYCIAYSPDFRLASRYSSMSPSSTLSQSLRSMLVRRSLMREASSTYERI
ncbi:hypothetical protein D3C75_1261580 [compost metagenome]